LSTGLRDVSLRLHHFQNLQLAIALDLVRTVQGPEKFGSRLA
jgi:hypothetical protein